MKLKTKIKIKQFIGRTLGVLLMLLALLYSYYKGKIIEISLSIITFYIYRFAFEKQWHSKSMFLCFAITTITLIILVNIELRMSISVLFAVTITFLLTVISYYIKDYFDNKLLVEIYRQKLCNINTKAIENLTEEELVELMPDIKSDIVRIVYNYIHKPKTLSALNFAYKYAISEATLYRYVRQIKSKYESLRECS